MKADVISDGIEDLQYKIDFFIVSDKLKSSNIRENLVSSALYFLESGSNNKTYIRFRLRVGKWSNSEIISFEPFPLRH